jgi:hypothetical protein
LEYLREETEYEQQFHEQSQAVHRRYDGGIA